MLRSDVTDGTRISARKVSLISMSVSMGLFDVVAKMSSRRS